jgi:hypothetical protein
MPPSMAALQQSMVLWQTMPAGTQVGAGVSPQTPAVEQYWSQQSALTSQVTPSGAQSGEAELEHEPVVLAEKPVQGGLQQSSSE